jgi:hypothetical protein
MFGPELMQAFREFKRLWDPEWKMNPGKVIDAYHADANLRLGIDYRPPQWPTHFRYPGDDHGSFPGLSCAAWALGNAAGSTSASCARAIG